jgi:hypothetical protein
MRYEEAVGEIYGVIRRINEFRDPQDQIACAEDSVLFGPGGHLDSLGLVSLVLDVEEAIDARAGLQLVLADERAMAQRRNPFRDVRSLAEHVMARIDEGLTCPSPPSS